MSQAVPSASISPAYPQEMLKRGPDASGKVNFLIETATGTKAYSIDPHTIEELSPETKLLLTKFGVELPEKFKNENLKGRVRSMDETERLLKEAEKNELKNRLIALAKTASIIVLVAGVILACLFGGEVGMGLGLFFGSLAYLFLTVILYVDAGEKIKNINGHTWYFPRLHERDLRAFFPLLGGGLILPLYEALTRKNRLKNALDNQRASFQEAFSTYLPEAHRFYAKTSTQVLDQLNQKIERLRTSLLHLEKAPERSLIGEAELRLELAAFRKAQSEWTKSAEFYQQFINL